MAIEFCDGNGFAGIDHLHTAQLVRAQNGVCGSPAGADDDGASQISQVFSQQLWRQPWGGAGLAGAELAEGRSQLRRGSEHLTRSRTTRKQPKPQRCISKLWPHWTD